VRTRINAWKENIKWFCVSNKKYDFLETFLGFGYYVYCIGHIINIHRPRLMHNSTGPLRSFSPSFNRRPKMVSVPFVTVVRVEWLKSVRVWNKGRTVINYIIIGNFKSGPGLLRRIPFLFLISPGFETIQHFNVTCRTHVLPTRFPDIFLQI